MLDDSRITPSSVNPQTSPGTAEPDSLRVADHKKKAETYKQEGRYGEAELEIKKAMEFCPTENSLQDLREEIDTLIQKKHLANARAFSREHKFEDAIFEYDTLLKRNPRNEEARAGLRETQRRFNKLRKHLSKGDEYRRQKKYREAIEEYEQVLEINPAHLYAKSEVEQCHQILAEQGLLAARVAREFKVAKAEYEGKRYQQAIFEAKKILEKVPDHPGALELLEASVNGSFRKRKRAAIVIAVLLTCCIYVLILYGFWNYSQYQSYIVKARQAWESGNWKEAINYSNKALDRRPGDEAALTLLSDSVSQQQEQAERVKQEMLGAKLQAERAQAKVYARTLYAEATETAAKGDFCLTSAQYDRAFGHYKNAIKEYKSAEKESLNAAAELDRLRTARKAEAKREADILKAHMLEAKAQADNEQASRYTKESYALAQHTLKAGNEKYQGQDYTAAADQYREAASLFRKSAEDAKEGKFLPAGMAKRDGKIISIKDGAEMVLIPAASFLAGSPPGEGSGNEQPRHRVYVDAFYMDRYEVTIQQYRNFLEATVRPPLPEWVHEYSPGDSYPVVGVSWDDAVAYAEWAGKRLPTEAEWEYACRAGTTTKYNVGDSITHSDANYSLEGGKDRWNEGTAPAGSFDPNPWGLHDMHGNVGEWCQDWYSSSYYMNCPAQNPAGPKEGLERAVRGGSWKDSSYALRSANRGYCRPSYARNYIGFRCAK